MYWFDTWEVTKSSFVIQSFIFIGLDKIRYKLKPNDILIRTWQTEAVAILQKEKNKEKKRNLPNTWRVIVFVALTLPFTTKLHLKRPEEKRLREKQHRCFPLTDLINEMVGLTKTVMTWNEACKNASTEFSNVKHFKSHTSKYVMRYSRYGFTIHQQLLWNFHSLGLFWKWYGITTTHF